jgi:YfiR/HmsC-like
MRTARSNLRRRRGALAAMVLLISAALGASGTPAAQEPSVVIASAAGGTGAISGAAPTEYEVKAVFVLNFSRFVVWPSRAFNSASQPFVIGVLGNDPFGPQLDEAVRGEQANGHPLVVRRFRDIADVGDCQILFIDQSEAPQLSQILAALDHRSTLTVTDLSGAARRGVMVQFDTVNHQIRLRINAASARAAGLTISSTLLRLAQIDRTDGE